jgi:hypothetical protein
MRSGALGIGPRGRQPTDESTRQATGLVNAEGGGYSLAMRVVFLSPRYPAEMRQFTRGLAEVGAEVLHG